VALLALFAVALVAAVAAVGRRGRSTTSPSVLVAAKHRSARDTVTVDTGFRIPERCATVPPVVARAMDSTRQAVGSAPPRDSVSRAGSHHRRKHATSPHDTAGMASDSVLERAFVYTPARGGSIFPGCRIVAYYGNPLSKRMGILEQIDPAKMIAKLDSQAAAYERADSTRPVLRALELIATVAQASPGQEKLYRLRMPDTLIEKVARWAEERHFLLILDIQTGRSTVASELKPLIPYLTRPYVHLALDPEFSVSKARVPGEVIGRMDAADVNVAVHALTSLVDSLGLPPKVLIVHRFTRPMLTNHGKIELDPRVQVVVDMDGFGPPHLKYSSYDAYVRNRPVQYPGFKLFYKNDKPLLTPTQVMALEPVPLFVMYQ